ncbi:Neurotransmitter-gated ion-channel transmembrane region [Ostertagia ostertagi]
MKLRKEQKQTKKFRWLFDDSHRIPLVWKSEPELSDCRCGRRRRTAFVPVRQGVHGQNNGHNRFGLLLTPPAAVHFRSRKRILYMLQIFVPAALVVAISWVSFWISRDSAPSRTIIGVMTVLTETHLMTGTNRRLPPVAYVKAVDVYLGFCYLLVVLALIEYACVAYSKKKNEDRRRREKKSEHKPTPPTPDLLHDARLAECTCNAAPTSIIAVIKQPIVSVSATRTSTSSAEWFSLYPLQCALLGDSVGKSETSTLLQYQHHSSMLRTSVILRTSKNDDYVLLSIAQMRFLF